MALFTAIGAAIFGAGTFLAAATATVLSIGASIGLSYVAKALAGSPANPSVPQDSFSIQGTLQSGGNVPRSFNVGYSATAGSLVYANTWGNDGDTPNAYLTQVIALADLPGGSLREVWVDGQFSTLGDTPHSDFGYPVLEYRKGGVDHLWVKFYDGNQTVADPFLVSRVGSLERPYEATRVGVGISYVVCTALIDDTLFTGIPKYKFAVSGVPLYDPSRDSTNGGSGSHRWSDQSTWEPSDLPAVQAYNVMRGFYFQGRWVYGLQGMTAARLPTSNWNAQIAKCRAEVGIGGGGTEPTYRTGGQINVSAQIGNTLETLLTGCQGKISEIGGFYKIHVGAPDSPTFSFTDDDILSTEDQRFTPFFGLSDSINGITASYPDPSQGWNVAVAPPYKVPELVARDGGRELFASPAFDFVPYAAQVQRLQKSGVEEARRERQHTLTLWSKFWYVEPGDVGEWTSARNGYVDKLFRVDGAIDQANLDVKLALTEVDPADYDWDHGTEYRPVTGGTTIIARPAPQGIVDWYAEPAIIKDASGLSRRPAIQLAWDGSVPGVLGVQYEVRLASDDSHVMRGRTDQLAAGATLISQSLLPDTAYETRGQYIPSSPRDMLWSDWLPVTTPNVKLGLIDFQDGLKTYVGDRLGEALANIDFTNQSIASLATEQDAANALDRRSTRTLISEQVGEVKVSITETAQIATQINGRLAAAWFLSINNDGYVSGIYQYNDGAISDFTVIADNFLVASPALPGQAPKPMFQVANVNGTPEIVFTGDMYADGSITAQMMNVGTLTAITANLGDAAVTGKLTGGPSGRLVLDFTNGSITGYRP